MYLSLSPSLSLSLSTTLQQKERSDSGALAVSRRRHGNAQGQQSVASLTLQLEVHSAAGSVKCSGLSSSVLAALKSLIYILSRGGIATCRKDGPIYRFAKSRVQAHNVCHVL